MVQESVGDLLVSLDYRLVEDAWVEHGRCTYLHEDDATRAYLSGLTKILKSAGWEIHPTELRAFRHPSTGEIIEIEPGGSEATGHFLHYMKPGEGHRTAE